MILLIVAAALILACADNNGRVSDSGNDSLSEWKAWAESSEPGVFSAGHSVTTELVRNYGQEESGIFYSPVAIDEKYGRLLVADDMNQRVLCFDSENGELLWSAGEAGEGPGHFSSIGDVAQSDSCVFAGSKYNNRVEIYSICGEYQGSIQAVHPFGLEVIGDSILVVTSLVEDHIVNLYSIETREKISSFGSMEAEYLWKRSPDNNTLTVTVVSDSIIVLAVETEAGFQTWNIFTEEMTEIEERRLPFEIPENTLTASYFHACDVTTMEDSLICVLLTSMTTDKEPLVDRAGLNRLANIAVVDRYLLSGEYAASFVLPALCYSIDASGSRFYTYHPVNQIVSEFQIVDTAEFQ
ncbi:hypothetical protein CSA37_00525 [Candidatus Fermentibacteria bacterium]|nr:MAG: hypothetical protein CSA37_09755 [Candidatus Fermentibacteria bacterium]PIE53684.1 MAG: hypothetical protein CSA37_00525 [Candidatus Fermentibacteria bacterium]